MTLLSISDAVQHSMAVTTRQFACAVPAQGSHKALSAADGVASTVHAVAGIAEVALKPVAAAGSAAVHACAAEAGNLVTR